jgi:TonB family protein
VTIVDALTQNLPAEGQTSTGVAKNIPEPFRGIVRECLHLDPAMRCSVDEIRARLQPAGRSVPVEEAETPQAEPSGSGRTIGIAAVVVLVAALAVWGVFFRKKPAANSPGETTEQTTSPAPAQTPSQAAPQQVTPAPAQAAPQSVEPPKPAAAVSRSKHAASAASASAQAGAAGGSVRRQVMPDIPQSAKRTISGTIKIAVHAEVDASGKVSSAKLKSAGPSRYFANKALQAAQGWEFNPPQVNGQPVASSWLIQFRLKRSSIQASPERLTH